jgi:hypothetical protein
MCVQSPRDDFIQNQNKNGRRWRHLIGPSAQFDISTLLRYKALQEHLKSEQVVVS